jgi:predicted MFS family arabinose efflux permease
MHQPSSNLKRNTRLLYRISFLQSLYFNDAIYVLFGVEYLHLNYFQAGSLFFIGWFVSIIFDFPGGVVADKLGRKHAQIAGLILQAVSFTPYVFTKSYPLLIVANVFWGIGIALSSNSLHALIYEQAKEEKSDTAYTKLNAMWQVVLFLAMAGASLVGGAIYTIDPRLPYGLLVVSLILATVATMRIQVPQQVERAVTDEPRPRIVHDALKTFRAKPSLLSYVVVAFLAGIFGDMLFSYYQPYYINLGVSAFTLGCLFAALRLVSGVGAYLMRTLPNKLSAQTIQLTAILAIIVTAVLMLILKMPFVLIAPLIVAVGFGFTEPNMRLFINNHANNQSRAAALSFGTTAMNLGVGIGFTVAFYMADHFSAHVILTTVIIGSAATAVWAWIAARLFRS